MENIKFRAGDTILSEGDEGDTAFLILKGSVAVTVGHGSKSKTVGTLGEGDVFGEMSLIEPGPRSATVRAATDTECVVTSYDAFMETLQQNPERAVEFMKILVRRLRQTNELVVSMDPRKRRFGEIFAEWQEAQVMRRMHGY